MRPRDREVERIADIAGLAQCLARRDGRAVVGSDPDAAAADLRDVAAFRVREGVQAGHEVVVLDLPG